MVTPVGSHRSSAFFSATTTGGSDAGGRSGRGRLSLLPPLLLAFPLSLTNSTLQCNATQCETSMCYHHSGGFMGLLEDREGLGFGLGLGQGLSLGSGRGRGLSGSMTSSSSSSLEGGGLGPPKKRRRLGRT